MPRRPVYRPPIAFTAGVLSLATCVSLMTRAWPIPGGRETWRREVGDRMRAVDDAALSSALLGE